MNQQRWTVYETIWNHYNLFSFFFWHRGISSQDQKHSFVFFGGAADFFDSPEMFLPQEPTRGLLIQAEINLLGEHHTLSPVPKALVVEVLVVLDDRTPHFAVAKEISQMQWQEAASEFQWNVNAWRRLKKATRIHGFFHFIHKKGILSILWRNGHRHIQALADPSDAHKLQPSRIQNAKHINSFNMVSFLKPLTKSWHDDGYS